MSGCRSSSARFFKKIGSVLVGRRSSNHTTTTANNNNSTVNTNNNQTKDPPLKYTEEELKDLKTAFGLLDRNQDGMVTANELQFMLRNLGIHVRDELIDDLMIQASENGNGLIDETEFLQWVAKIQAIREESQEPRTEPVDIDDDLTQDLIAAFRVFDRDGNGYITRDELQTAMDMIGEAVTEQQLNDLLTLADLDKDGKINYEEFARLLL